MTGPLLGREPVVTVSTVVALLIAILPVFGWSPESVGAVTAALVVLGGMVEAALVSIDRALPRLVGVGKAIIAAVASFGVHLPDNWVAALMAVLTIVAGLQVRKQVSPIQPPTDRDGRAVDRNGWPVGILDTASSAEVYARNEGLPNDAPPLPESGGEAHTEVFGAVAADGPLPEQPHGRHARERQADRPEGHGFRRLLLSPEHGS